MAIASSNNQSSLDKSSGMQFSLRNIIVTLYRRKWVVLVVACPVILAGGFALFNQTGSYWATARVLVELANVDQPRWNATGNNVDYDRELSTMFNIAMSTSVGEVAAISLKDSIPVIRELDPMLAGIQGVEDLTGYLLGNTNVTVIGESRILEFQFHAPHPRLALMGVGAMRDAFANFQAHGKKNNQAINYYEEQIAEFHARVDSLLSRRAKILEQAGYSVMSDQLKVEAGSRIEAEYELTKVSSNRQAIEIRYQGLLAALDSDPREFPMGQDESRSYSLVDLRKLVIDHENTLDRLKTVHTPNSPPVRQQQELLDAALQNLRREERSYVESVRIALEEARSRESRLEDLVATYDARQRSAPRAAYLISMIDTETNSMRDVMKNLQVKLGEVRIAHEADDRVSAIIPLTHPTLSEAMSSGKSIIYFIMLVFFAVALGVIAAFILETLDHRISNSDEIMEHLNLPVFASIRKAR